MKEQARADLGRSLDEMELAELMRSALNGDSQRYALLLQRVEKLMRSFVGNSFSRLGLAASGGHDDVVQEILLAIHAKRATFDPDQYFLPWMYAIGRYKVIDHMRRHKNMIRATVSLEDELEVVESLAAPEVGAGIDIRALCEELPEKQRRVILLVKLEGLSVRETSARTGYSESDIKVTVHRAIKALKEKVIEYADR